MPFTHIVMIKLVSVKECVTDRVTLYLIYFHCKAAKDAEDRKAKAQLLKKTIEGMNGQVCLKRV